MYSLERQKSCSMLGLDNSPKPSIMVAANGARRSKEHHPRLPISLDEILLETQACAAAGAQALHLHIRDEAGQHTLDAGRYRETLREIERVLPGFPVQVTTESAGIFEVQAQLECLRALEPKAASISVREIARDVTLARMVYGQCADAGTHVQHILYNMDDWHQFRAWQNDGTINAGQDDVILVLGKYAPPRNAMQSDLADFVSVFNQACGRVMVCAFGRVEHQVLCAAAAMGADLRIGFENNIYGEDGRLAVSNADQIARLVAAIPSLNAKGISS
jgi:uncharacterized protein (DUF849 family)